MCTLHKSFPWRFHNLRHLILKVRPQAIFTKNHHLRGYNHILNKTHRERIKNKTMEELKPRKANSSPLIPLGFLERAATAYDDCPFIIYDDITYTWSQTHHRCLQVASSVTSLSIKRGHVVSGITPNSPPLYELHFAVPMSGKPDSGYQVCRQSLL